MDLRHYDHDGRARFITFNIYDGVPILTNDEFRQAVVDAIADQARTKKLRLLAYVIMPEHVHIVAVPPIDLKLGPVIGLIKNKAARAILKTLRQCNSPLLSRFHVMRNGMMRFALWERRCFDHNCRSESAVLSRIKYCHDNPVLRKLVEEPQQFEWSSCRWYLGWELVKLPMNPS